MSTPPSTSALQAGRKADGDRGSSLVPIWALAHSHKIDYTPKATGVSTRASRWSSSGTNEHAFVSQGSSYLQRSVNANQHDERCRKPPPPQGGKNRRTSINHYTHVEDDAVSEYDGTKTWIRSGNKWIITQYDDRLAGAITDKSVISNKVNPTAVSSFGKNSHDFKVRSEPTLASPLSRSRWDQARDTASAISSFAGSSSSGLYTRQRLTKTPGGFPFMPALHLAHKKGTGGISVTSGITRNLNVVGGITEKNRFQRSYLLNARPVSNRSKCPLQEKDTSRDKLMDQSHSSSHPNRQSYSDYDSEREERLREWKEKFVQKFIVEDNDIPSRIRKPRSLDSECDSEVNLNTAQLKEWQEVQYRRSEKFASTGTRSRNHSRPKMGNFSYTTSPVITPSRITDSNQIENNLTEPYISTRNTFDTENDSFNYTDRLKEWKEKQYEDHGASFQPLPTQVEVFGETTSKSLDYDYESYDSDPSRKQRLKEWKEQFASGPVRFSSTSVETGVGTNTAHFSDFAVDQEQSLETIYSPAKKSSRRGRTVPGGGFFPVTSPQRKGNAGATGTSKGSPFHPCISKLPPMSPLRNLKDIENISTPKRANSTLDKKKKNADTNDAKVSDMVEETHVVAKAAKFFLGLTPQLSSEEGPLSPTGDCFSTALDINSPCKVLPSLSTELNADHTEGIKSPITVQGAMQLPINLWNRARTNSPRQTEDTFLPIGDSTYFSMHPSQTPLQSWDNCLYVKAEGARNGRVCITSTHLVFLYEDDLSNSLLARYGWNRDQIDSFLLDMEGPSSRGATPINVPLDESGEGGGIELIGSDNSTVNFMDLLEDGFAYSNIRAMPEEHEGHNFDKMEHSVCADSFLSSIGSSLSPGDELNTSVVVKRLEENTTCLREDRKEKKYPDEIPPISLTSSSFDSMNNNDETQKTTQSKTSNVNSFGLASNEEVVNSCILRAFKEEAHRRLQEDERTATQSAVHRLSVASNGSDHDFQDLYRNQTNISSFSDIDMEIDPDQERTLYISDEADAKQKYIGIRWPLSKLAEVFDRRYMMKEVGLEIFAPSESQLTTSSLRQGTTASNSTLGGNSSDEVEVPLGPLSRSSLYLVIPGLDLKLSSRFRRKKTSRRDLFLEALKSHAIQLNDAYWLSSPWLQRKWEWRKIPKTDTVSALTRSWRKGHVSNFHYLLRLNAISGRSFHDPGNYPIMPWVLSNFTSDSVPDLSDDKNYRDLTKPMGALCPVRLRKFQEKYASLCSIMDTAIPPFMYGSHYSNTGGVVLHYLVRVRPFAGLHRQLQVIFKSLHIFTHRFNSLILYYVSLLIRVANLTFQIAFSVLSLKHGISVLDRLQLK